MKMSWSIRLRWPWVIRRRLPAKMVEVIARRVVDEMLDDAAKALAEAGWRPLESLQQEHEGLLVQVWKPGIKPYITTVKTHMYGPNYYWRPSGIGRMQIDAGTNKVTA